MIFMYLMAIVAANLSIVYFGPSAAIVNAFIFIGLDITARDTLHEQWNNDRLVFKMTLLILAGSLLSYTLNRDAGRIAIASLLAFMVSGAIDTMVYWLLSDAPKLVKVNGSNVASAGVDSLLFILIAFGYPVNSYIVIAQTVSKIFGGFMWSLILTRRQPPQPDPLGR